MIKTKTLDFIGGFLFPVFTISEPPAGTNVNQQLPIKLYYGAATWSPEMGCRFTCRITALRFTF